MKTLLALVALSLPLLAAERLPEDRGAAGLWQSLKRLENPVRVLYIQAHPDDEDPALLTYLSRGLGCEVTLLSLNRGEGGANVVSGDFFEGLAALRTVEMLRAAAHYGVAVRFTRAADYGYSKSIDEAFRSWKKEEVLADVLRVLREVKPHIVISRFNDAPRDGHGHHQAAGRLAKEAFQAAQHDAWKPLKLYTTNWREGEPVTLKINTGAYDAVLGRSYAEIGREGYRHHRSQGMAGNVAPKGPVYAYLKREDANVAEQSLLAGLPPANVHHGLRTAREAFDARAPEKSAPGLVAALQATPNNAPERPAIARALALSLGLELEALVLPENPPTGPFAIFRPIETITVAQAGQSFGVKVMLHQRGPETVSSVKYDLAGPWSATAGPAEGEYKVKLRDDAQPTVAPWRRNDVRESMYTLDAPALFGLALPPTGMVGRASFTYRGVEATLEEEIETTRGAVRQPLVIAPPLSVEFAARGGYLPLRQSDYEVAVVLKNFNPGELAGTLRLESEGREVGRAQEFRIAKSGETLRILFRLSLGGTPVGTRKLRAIAKVADKDYDASFEAITQPGYRVAYLGRTAEHRLQTVDLALPAGLRVGYIMGSGDEVPEALRQLGVAVDLLDAAALSSADLARYNAVVVGIRAYAVREDLRANNQRLLDYASQGGHVLVQYQTQEYDRNFGPFPYTQGRGAEEVSEEDAPVTLLAPEHPALTTPNRITAADFAGWVEQRGSKFFSTWDAGWTPLVETHDTGQAPQRGVWLEAKTGKGLYTYCALALYRQTPFAVPGAARLLANLVSRGMLKPGN
ncbi:MAG: PIG-L family deacetylase [Bryobacter sp.]